MTSKPTSTSEFKKSLFRFGQMMRQEVGISKNHAKDDEFEEIQHDLHAIETRGYRTLHRVEDFLNHWIAANSILVCIHEDLDKETKETNTSLRSVKQTEVATVVKSYMEEKVKRPLLQYLEKIKLVKDLNEKRKNAVLELNYTHDQVNNITEKMRTKKPERVLELNSLFHQKILEYEDLNTTCKLEMKQVIEEGAPTYEKLTKKFSNVLLRCAKSLNNMALQARGLPIKEETFSPSSLTIGIPADLISSNISSPVSVTSPYLQAPHFLNNFEDDLSSIDIDL